jgi:DNA-binding CsgD family transcriptional regulator
VGFVARDDEFAILQELLADCLRSRSRVAVISGGVATGKTTLLRAFGERAKDSGFIFLSAVASATEGNVALGMLEQLFCSPDLPGPSTVNAAQWLDVSASVSPVYEVAPGANTGQIAPPAFRGLREVVRELAEHQPVVIGIDDMHYADETSLRCLLYLLRRLRAAPVLIVLTECPRPRAEKAPLLNEFLRMPHCRQIKLEPLSTAGVSALLAKELPERSGGEGDHHIAQRLAPAFHAASAGHPALVHALIDDYLSAPEPADGELLAGAAFGQAVLDFLYRHEPPVMEVAQAIAILPEAAPLKLLGRLTDIDVGSAAQAVNTLTNAGILASGNFRHHALRTAVVDGIPPDRRRALHGRAANLLYSEGAPPEKVAVHIVATGDNAAPWVIPVLQEAAERALAADDLSTGISYLRTAYQLCEDKSRRLAISSALADAEWRVDPAAALRHLPEFNTAAHEGLLDVRDAATPVTSLLWHGRVPEALGIIDELAQKQQGTADQLAATSVDLDTPRLWLSYLYPEWSKDVTAPEKARASHDPAPLVIDPARHEATVLLGDLLNGDEDEALVLAEAILERSHLDHKTLAPLTIALAALTYNDRLGRAATWCDAFLDEAESRRSPTWRALFMAVRSMIYFRQGALVAAEKYADAAMQLIPPKSWGVAIGLPLASQVLARTSLGKVQHAAEDLGNITVPEAMFQTPMGLHYLYARGQHYLAAHHFHAALHDFCACGQLADSWGSDPLTVEPWRVGAAEAHLMLGDTRQARHLVDEQLALADPGQARTRGISLRIRAATDDLQSRGSLLRESVELLQSCGDRLELSRAFADLGDTYRRLGENEWARAMSRKAHILAGQCKADTEEEVSAKGGDNATLSDSDGDRTRGGLVIQLSDAERRVAALAADGYTNREISRKLFITVSTVEQHLTKIYRKLNVKRFDLQSALRRQDAQSAIGGENGSTGTPPALPPKSRSGRRRVFDVGNRRHHATNPARLGDRLRLKQTQG